MAVNRLRIVNRMPQFVDAVQHRAARGIVQALTLGASEAAAMTPQHTSNLINSRYSHVDKQGAKIVGRVGYTAEYALWVHEAKGTLKGQPRPVETGKPQGNYWDPRGEPRFLSRGFERALPNIRAVLKRALKV